MRKGNFQPHFAGRQAKERLSSWLFTAASLLGIFVLLVLFCDILRKGAGWLNWDFLTGFPSRFPERAGIKSALWGSVWLVGLTGLISIPVGIASAIYLEEYTGKSWLTNAIQTNINNLAGVPSVVYGVLGLAVFVRSLALGRSILAGALTISLLILPIIIIATQEALRAVPDSLRQGSLALGATRWQTIRNLVLPAALPGILTGIILAMSRALGETAPLVTIGALTFIARTPNSPLDPFTVLPTQIYNWTSRPQADFQNIAAAAIIVLLVVLLFMNAAAILLRNKYQGKANW